MGLISRVSSRTYRIFLKKNKNSHFTKMFLSALRRQMYRNSQQIESLQRIPVPGRAPRTQGLKWSEMLLLIGFFWTAGSFIPYNIIAHTRNTFKEARISEWYQTQKGCPIKDKAYKQWEEPEE